MFFFFHSSLEPVRGSERLRRLRRLVSCPTLRSGRYYVVCSDKFLLAAEPITQLECVATFSDGPSLAGSGHAPSAMNPDRAIHTVVGFIHRAFGGKCSCTVCTARARVHSSPSHTYIHTYAVHLLSTSPAFALTIDFDFDAMLWIHGWPGGH